MINVMRAMSIGCCAVLLSGWNGCTFDDTTPGDCNEFTSEFTIEDRMQQSVEQFTAGEAITFRLDITNNSLSPEALTIPDRCPQVRFEVVDANNQVVWNSAEGIFCAQVVTTNRYEPGETQTYSATWEQLRRNGEAVPVGAYTARAVDRSECSDRLSQSAQFAIQ